VNVPLPDWVEAWPRGLRPVRIHAAAAGARLLYVHPDGGWVQLWIARGPTGVTARQGDAAGFERSAPRRLRAAVLRRFELDAPASTRWLEQAQRLVAALEGREGAREASDEARALAATLEGAPGGDEGLAKLRARAPGCDDGIRVLRARFDPVRALEGFDPDAAPEPPPEAAALACRAFLSAMTGLSLAAIELAERAAELARGVEERGAVAELLVALGRPGAALACLTAGDSEGRIDRTALARAAAEARDPEAAARAVRDLLCSDADDDAQDRAIASLASAGGHAEAIAALEERCARRPSAAALARLAELRLFGLELDPAETAARRALALDEDHELAQLVLGAVASARGDHAEALERLARIEPGPHHPTAQLWRMRSLLGLGRVGDAVAASRVGGFADRVAWKLWRAYAEARDAPEATLRGKESFQVRIVLEQMFGAEETARAYERDETAIELLWRAIERLGGNYGDEPTFLEGGRLVRAALISPRNEAVAGQHTLATRPLEEVLAEFDAQAQRMPSSPFPRTYRAEMVLWSGDYETAREAFGRIWEQTHTRWGYVGLGAALGFLGHHEEALAAWEAGLEHYEYLPAEATYAYRGEVLLELGRPDEAIEQLEHATEANDRRIGAWNGLALARATKGDAAGARAALDRLAERAPGLLCFAAASAGVGATASDLDSVRTLATRIRRAMAGNRASGIYTFLDDAGRLRVLRSAPRRHWLGVAERIAPLALDVACRPLGPR
jgi:tetratricopeptide (TPR) repeat protein